ncbi:MAG: ABC transporter ATP-binding protein [Clostridia bacterium]|nr:ABC transporter ATP-binding protein [Clostridia bacterium]
MSHQIEIRNVYKSFGVNAVLQDISLDVERGELVTLLGPSGCGKSTLLRSVAGLLPVDAGQVCIDGRDMTAVIPQKRDVGMVFQSYALFPNMTAVRNIAFGLSIRRTAREEIARRVAEMVDLVGLKGLEHRYPSQLSGGQQQRVALARALIMNPKVLLLDEPLSALDAQIRQNLRVQIREIQQRRDITAVFVTHDQEEAMSISDRIFVMHNGRIVQAGTPAMLYARPASEFTARFIGHYNVLYKEQAQALFGDGLPPASVYAVRPEAFVDEDAPGLHRVRGVVTALSMLGSVLRYALRCGEVNLSIEQMNRGENPHPIGDAVEVYLDPNDIVPIQEMG